MYATNPGHLITHLPLLVGKRECSHYFIFPPKHVSYNKQRPRSKSLPSVRNVPEVEDEWLISRGSQQHNRELLTRVPGQLGHQCKSMRPADRTWSISRGGLQRRAATTLLLLSVGAAAKRTPGRRERFLKLARETRIANVRLDGDICFIVMLESSSLRISR